MSSRHSKAFTLVEILLAAAIGLVVLGVIYQLWSYSRFVSSSAHQGFLLAEDIGTAFRSLQRELSETSLASIVATRDSVSFLSARDEKGMHIGSDGAPHWVKKVRYSLRPTRDPAIGQLVREEEELDHHAPPYPEPVKWKAPPGPEARVITQSLLMPDYAFAPGPSRLLEIQPQKDAEGGFVVRFIRHEHGHRVFTLENPCSKSDHQEHHWTQGNTHLVQAVLGVTERDSSTGNAGFVELRMRVRPAHE